MNEVDQLKAIIRYYEKYLGMLQNLALKKARGPVSDSYRAKMNEELDQAIALRTKYVDDGGSFEPSEVIE